MRKKHFVKELPLTPFESPEAATRLLNQLRELLGVAKRLDYTPSAQPFGADVLEFFQAAGGAVQDGKALFQGLPFDGKQMAELQARYQRVAATQQKTAELANDLATERRFLEAEMARMIGLVLKTARTTLESPVAPDGLKQVAATAASALFSLSEGRNAQKRAALHATKARNKKEAERASKAQKLTIENRYLSGEDLGPEDVGAAPLPLAARAARRRQKR